MIHNWKFSSSIDFPILYPLYIIIIIMLPFQKNDKKNYSSTFLKNILHFIWWVDIIFIIFFNNELQFMKRKEIQHIHQMEQRNYNIRVCSGENVCRKFFSYNNNNVCNKYYPKSYYVIPIKIGHNKKIFFCSFVMRQFS